MKLVIKEHCVVKGGKIVEKGDIHDTGDIAKKEDREAYELIAAGRAVEVTDKDAVAEIEEQVASEKQTKAARKAAEKAGKAEK